MTHDELIKSLLAERYNGRGWAAPAIEQETDDDVTCARRRREMAKDFEATKTRPRKVA